MIYKEKKREIIRLINLKKIPNQNTCISCKKVFKTIAGYLYHLFNKNC